MRRAVPVFCVLIALIATRPFGAEPAGQPQPSEQPAAPPAADTAAATRAPKPVIPERKITFQVSDEEKPVPLYVAEANLEMLIRCYSAEFRLVTAGETQPGLAAVLPELPGLKPMSLREAAGLDVDHYNAVMTAHTEFFARSSFASFPGMRGGRGMRGLESPGGGTPFSLIVAEHLPRILEGMPQGHAPSDDVVTLLTENRYPRLLVRVEPTDDPHVDVAHFTVYAPTPEQTEALVRGLLSLLDYGVFYPLQETYLAAKQAYERYLVTCREALASARKEELALNSALPEMAEYEDLTVADIKGFRLDLRRIAVDLESVKARIQACEEFRNKPPTLATQGVLDQLDVLRIAAEVEMVGLVAKQDAIEALIKAAEERTGVLDRRDRAAAMASHMARIEKTLTDAIAGHEENLNRLVPYPVEGGKVTIHPVKWLPSEE